MLDLWDERARESERFAVVVAVVEGETTSCRWRIRSWFPTTCVNESACAPSVGMNWWAQEAQPHEWPDT